MFAGKRRTQQLDLSVKWLTSIRWGDIPIAPFRIFSMNTKLSLCFFFFADYRILLLSCSQAFLRLNKKFSGEVLESGHRSFPDEYFTCAARCQVVNISNFFLASHSPLSISTPSKSIWAGRGGDEGRPWPRLSRVTTWAVSGKWQW